MRGVAAQLRAAGMSERESLAKERLFTACSVALDANGVSVDRSAFFVPGRIEVLGKHTDYAGGRSLLCAVERGFIVIAAPRADGVVDVTDARLRQQRCLALDPELEIPRADWSTYVAASIRRLARNFAAARRGADIAFASDLPQASGMSSSSALSTAIFFALDAVNDFARDPAYRAEIDSREALAGYLGTIENGQSFGSLAGDHGVGTFGGSEDHTAILCCRAGVLSRYSFAPVRFEEEIPLPETHTFVVAHSGVEADKGSAAQARYNELSLAVQRIVELWNARTGRADRSLAAAVESDSDAADRIRGIIRSGDAQFAATRLLERFDQFMTESYEIIPAASRALASADHETFGSLVDRSQRGAEALLRNQVPETVRLVALARREGAVAASAFGGGFGGSVWALVPVGDVDGFVARWRATYGGEFPGAAARAEFIVTGPGPASMSLSPGARFG